MLFGVCASCNAGGQSLTVYFPLAGLIYTLTGFFLFSCRFTLPRSFYGAFFICSLIVPLIQVYFLRIEPKLCPGCLLITFCAAIYSVSSLIAVRDSKVEGFYLGRTAVTGVAFCFLFLFSRDVLILNGIVKQPSTSPTVKSIVGKDWSRLTRGVSPASETIFVITNEGCHACSEAKQDLRKLSIPHRIVPICTILKQDGCFNGAGQSFPTPMLIALTKGGRVKFQYNGWTSDPVEKTALKKQLQALSTDESQTAPTLIMKGNVK